MIRGISASVLRRTALTRTFRLFLGNIDEYLSTDVNTWANGRTWAENLAFTVPRDQMKLKSSKKCHNLH